MNPIEQAVSILGGKSAAARRIGVKPQAIYQWLNETRPVPATRCVAIERLTEGVVTRRHLRPDDWQAIWPELVKKRVAAA